MKKRMFDDLVIDNDMKVQLEYDKKYIFEDYIRIDDYGYIKTYKESVMVSKNDEYVIVGYDTGRITKYECYAFITKDHKIRFSNEMTEKFTLTFKENDEKRWNWIKNMCQLTLEQWKSSDNPLHDFRGTIAVKKFGI